MTAKSCGLRGWVPALFCMLLAGCSTKTIEGVRCPGFLGISWCSTTAMQAVQVLRWDALAALGRIHESPAVRIAYSRLNIDLEQLGRVLRIQMPDGKILPSSGPLETFWPYTKFGRRAKLPTKFHCGTRFFDVIFSDGLEGTIGGYSLEFEDGRMVGLSIQALPPATPETICPAVGNSVESELYVLPLTEAQLIQFFGPYRDKIVVNSFDAPVSAPAAVDETGPTP